jgi:NAD(P)-dependent dehydrogenase (short-subunit alcohol dehydrogenase family)
MAKLDSDTETAPRPGTHAGIARGGAPSQTDLAVMREVYEVNVFDVIRVTNAMLPLLRRSPAARIVNVSMVGVTLVTKGTKRKRLGAFRAIEWLAGLMGLSRTARVSRPGGAGGRGGHHRGSR